MAKATQMHTIYHAMDRRGVFDTNPANAQSDQYAANGGAQEYPRMLYSPKGEVRVTNPGEIIVTPMGPKEVGRQTELICKIVKNAEEELSLVKQGWHLHPADAIRASGADAPAVSPQQRMDMLLEEKAKMEKELNDLRALAAKAPLVPAKPHAPALVD